MVREFVLACVPAVVADILCCRSQLTILSLQAAHKRANEVEEVRRVRTGALRVQFSAEIQS
jgi:hypothetical protein